MTKYHEAGKGPGRRPCQVSDEEFSERWDAIFGTEKEEETCMTCDSELENGICLEQLRTQRERT